jgi:AGZA family xanthine/uracil permease-like MFS transporter
MPTATASSSFERWFGIRRAGSTPGREVIAGLTTFAAMAYILAVNPGMLSETGMDKGALISATALASAIMTAVFALATNYPIALAPGMGMNGFFTYTLCLQHGIPWQAALGMVFVSGFLFLALSVTGARRKIIEAIPPELKAAISCGIGLFIAFIGFQKAGIVTDHQATLVTVGDMGSPPALLALGCLILAAALVWKRVQGAILISIAVGTLVGLFLPDSQGGTITRLPDGEDGFRLIALPASLKPLFLQLDIGHVLRNLFALFPLILALLFVDLFDNMGTLIGVSRRAGLLDAQGHLPRLGRALTADASAAMVGSTLGTSTVTSYIESAAGVEAGGRTGLTALVVSLCFLAAMFFHPLIQLVPSVATAPALILVGVFMMQSIAEIPWEKLTIALPAALTILLMPLTYSISEGLAIGFLSWTLIELATGGWRRPGVAGWALAALFLAHILTR